MSNFAIKVTGLGKQYRIGSTKASYSTLRESIVDGATAPFRRVRQLVRGQAYGAANLDEIIWALRDVSFTVNHGEVVGIIGRNGAGKSTLLKILSRITEPTEGEVRIRGRVGSLLEVGTGFHPELTGRENVYLNGAILGMMRHEIERKFDEIVDFAGVEKFIDTPVKHYSSGMGLRLGFAVAAHLEPEILVVDEVLAVGDFAFQKKCLGKMSDVANSGRTVLFVSHNMAAVQNLCTRCIRLNEGQLVDVGSPEEIIAQYLTASATQSKVDLSQETNRKGDGAILISQVAFRNAQGEYTDTFMSGEDMTLRFNYAIPKSLSENAKLVINIGVKNIYDTNILLLSNELTSQISSDWPTVGVLECFIPNLALVTGRYSINLFVTVNDRIADWIIHAAAFNIEQSDFFGTGRFPQAAHAQFLIKHTWDIYSEPQKDD
jgi:lipopolysaccharide transport system ATP-binding protein